MDATSQDLDRLDKDTLVDTRGRKFKEYKRALKPRYGVVWVELLAGHVALGATVLFLVKIPALWPPLAPLAIAVGAFAIGYAVAYIQLFFHEAAHYNIAPSKRTNDALANAFIGALVGQDIRAYRPIHFDHHRYLGTPQDTERTYFDPLDFRFIVESLTGIKILKVLMRRESVAKGEAKPGAQDAKSAENAKNAGNAGNAKKSLLNAQLLLGLAFHASLLGVACWLGEWSLAAAWLLGMGVVFPFFAAVRQVLEHRDFAARRDVDYRKVPHGATNRLFGSGPLASTLGGAGFNRHLLHHWEPQVSYTQLRALEAYLLDTDAAPVFLAHRTTYVATFVRLMRGTRAPVIENATEKS